MDSVNGYEAPAPREFPAPSTTTQVARTRLADHVYTHLLQRIVTGEYAEGAALPPENGLCGMFGVSRPVVREALDRLRADELIESRRGSGTYVRPRVYDAQAETPLLLQKRQKLYLRNLEFRGAIEPRAAALAALRHTPAQLDEMKSAVDRYEQVAVNKGTVAEHLDFAFHQAVAQASNNDHFTDAIRSIAFDIDHGVNLLRYLANFHHIARSRSVLADHTRILEAIARRDAGAAEAAMREHIQHAWLRVSEPLPLVDADPTNPTI